MKRLIPLILCCVILCGCVTAQPGIPSETQEYIDKLEQIILDAGLSLPGESDENKPFTLVWIPDTQKYAQKYTDIFTSVTKWIVSQKNRLNIKYALHTGDIVDDYDDEEQWRVANNSLSLLEGHIPLFITAGNHDINGSEQIYSPYIENFGASVFSSLPTFGGAYESGIGRYDLLEAGGEEYLLITVGYAADDNAYDWMNGVLKQYPESTAIIILHSYIDADGNYTADGSDVFPKIVTPNPNVKLVLCGHRDGAFHNKVQFDDDNDGTTDREVMQVLFNPQSGDNGGGGYINLIQFDPVSHTVSVKSYSPYLNDYTADDSNPGLEEFTFTL